MTTSITGSIKFFNNDKNFGFVTVKGIDHHFNKATLLSAGFSETDATAGAVVKFIPQTGNTKPRVENILRIGLEQARPPKAKKVRRLTKSSKKSSPELQTIEIGRRYSGTVISYHDSRGFGFLEVEGHKAVFFHASSMIADDIPVDGAEYFFTGIMGRQSVAAGMLFQKFEDTTFEDYKKVVWMFGGEDARPIKPNELRRTQVDKNDSGDKLIKVTRCGRLIHFEVERASHMGTYILEGVRSLARAREMIGKILPEIMTESQPTNVPGQGPRKGPSPGADSFKKGQSKKRAA